MKKALKKYLKKRSLSGDQMQQVDIALTLSDDEILDIVLSYVFVLSKQSSFIINNDIAIVNKDYFLKLLKKN